MKPTKKAVRKMIVMRKVMQEVGRVPFMRKQANAITEDLLNLADKYGLKYALVTKKF